MQQKRVTGAKECTWTSFGSLSPPKCHIFRQKSAKINFGMSLLHKIIGVTPRYARETAQKGAKKAQKLRNVHQHLETKNGPYLGLRGSKTNSGGT